MSLEIERKFLVKGEAWRGLAEPVRIRQGYVATADGTTVRVRVAGDAAFTLKDPCKPSEGCGRIFAVKTSGVVRASASANRVGTPRW